MSAYLDTLKFLYALQRRGITYGLHNTRLMLKSLDNPHRRFPALHVAGTNGKGSTAAFLASIFMEAGCKTALYTSPHLVRFTERIRINGKEIPEPRLVAYARRLRPMIDDVHATFFESTTCIAFQYFADEQVDIAIVETGLGGRLDATNVLKPLVSIITNIDFDHQEYLGSTIKAIAREKGGIIKRGAPCVTGARERESLKVFKALAVRRRTTVSEARRLVKVNLSGNRGTSVSFRSKHLRVDRVRLGFSGNHQATNARLALAAIELLLRTTATRNRFRNLDATAVRHGFERVLHNTGLRGRFERVGKKYLLDVGHNPAGIRTAISSLRDTLKGNCVVVFGAMKDKDYVSMLRSLRDIARVIVAVAPRIERALSSKELVRAGEDLGIPMVEGGGVRTGVVLARKLSERSSPVFVTGSHYVVGEALQFLQREHP